MVRRTERGTTLVELMVASTLFSVVGLAIVSVGGDFSRTLAAQMEMEDTYTRSNVVRARLLGDAGASSVVDCIGSGDIAFTLDDPGATSVEYYLDGNDLIRWSHPPDKETPVVDSVSAFECNDLGSDGVYVSLSLGNDDYPYHLHFRVSDSGS